MTQIHLIVIKLLVVFSMFKISVTLHNRFHYLMLVNVLKKISMTNFMIIFALNCTLTYKIQRSIPNYCIAHFYFKFR